MPPGPAFASRLAMRGPRPAVVTGGGLVTYAELDERVDDLAARLGPRRRLVALGAANGLEALVAYLAALRGGHPLLLAPACAVDDLAAAHGAEVTIGAATDWEPVERGGPGPGPLHPDLALLLPTSGSTGSSKLVRLSGANLDANAASIAHYLRLTPEDRAITTLPLQYCYGLSVANSHLRAGASLALTSLSVLDGCFWELFRSAGATSLAGVPHTFELLDRAGFASMDLPSLRYLTQAGGRMHPDTVRRYAALGRRNGFELFVMYGQTEATARIAYLPPAAAEHHPGAIGVAIPGGTLAVEGAGEDGVGELVYRGPNVMMGYAEGPGDLARCAGPRPRRNDAGLYEIVGRRSRFVKPFGVRVDLDGLERLLAGHRVTAACTGDDADLVVGVVGAAGASSAARLVARRTGLPRWCVRVVALGELPRLGSGKPDYEAVRRAAGPRPPRAGSRPGADPAAAVRAAFRDVLGADPGPGDTFVGLGGDSLSYVELSLCLEEALGELPRDWHTTPVGRLERAGARPRRGTARRLDTSAVVRAVAIALIVGTHADLWHLPGGAHTLLAVTGFNFARFQLSGGSLWSSVARLAVPSMCWIALVAALAGDIGWAHVALLSGHLGPPGAPIHYWYVEVVAQVLVALALLFALGPVRRVEQRVPYAFALAVTAASLALRFDLLGPGAPRHRLSQPLEVFWLFALGWLVARSTTTGRRLVVSALTLAAVPGFFGDPARDLVVVLGILLVTWVPAVPVPRRAVGVVGAVAGASLSIYLAHWQVHEVVGRHLGPLAALGASLVAGVALQAVGDRATGAVRARWAARLPAALGVDHAGQAPAGGGEGPLDPVELGGHVVAPGPRVAVGDGGDPAGQLVEGGGDGGQLGG